MTAGEIWAKKQREIGMGPKVRASLSEVFALLLKAGIGSGLPLGHTQALAAAAGWFASSPDLMISVVGAVMREHTPLVSHEDGDTLVIEECGAAMVAPAVVDALMDNTKTVRLNRVDFPDVLMALLDKAQRDYDVYFAVETTASGAMNVSLAKTGKRRETGELELVPQAAIDALSSMAAKTFVPATAASREKGAGAGLNDND